MVSEALQQSGLNNFDFTESKIEYAVREKPNLVFIGPSYVDMGVNPEIFDNASMENGIRIRSFNLGIDGLSIVEMNYVLTKLLNKLPHHIRYAILSPCFECLNVGRKTNNIRSINFFNLSNSIEFINYIFSYRFLPDPPLPRVQYIENVISALSRHYTNLGLGGVAFGWHDSWAHFDTIEPNFNDPSFWPNRGPRGQGLTRQTMRPQDQDAYEMDLSRIQTERPQRINALLAASHSPEIENLVTNAGFAFFARLVSRLEARGVAVFVIQPPNIWQWQYEAAFIARLHLRCGHQLPLIDYGDIATHEELYLPPSIRYDSAHLDADGAVVWSDDLARDFAHFLKAGAFEHPIDCLSSPISARSAPSSDG